MPTEWTEDERLLLRGTSLEAAVNAKVSALDVEFEAMREASSDIPCWHQLLWEHGTVSFQDWIRLDALYRSRCLELPRSGESMVRFTFTFPDNSPPLLQSVMCIVN